MIESDVEAGYRVYPRKPWTLGLTIDSAVIEANLTIGIKISDAIGLELYGTNSFLQGRSFAVGPGEFIVRQRLEEILGEKQRCRILREVSGLRIE